MAATAVITAAGTGVYLGVRSPSINRPEVEFVLGGGTASTGSGPKLKVPGKFQAMTADRSGNVALFVSDDRGYELWTVNLAGKAESVRVPALDNFADQATGQASQAAAAPDGSYYIALGSAGLWNITKDGTATQIIKTGNRNIPSQAAAGKFATWTVDGVAAAQDGSIYFTDSQTDRGSALIHELKAGEIKKIAGKILSEDQEIPKSNPNHLSLKIGAPANSTFIPYRFNTGPLAWYEGSLYLHSGTGILRISTTADRIFPVVGARNPGALQEPTESFKPFGKAINGYVSATYGGDEYHASSISVDPSSGDVYFGTGDPRLTDTRQGISANFDWGGSLSSSQRNFIEGTHEEQVIYQINKTGDLSAVTARSKSLAIANGYLYIANDSCHSEKSSCTASDQTSAVIRIRLP